MRAQIFTGCGLIPVIPTFLGHYDNVGSPYSLAGRAVQAWAGYEPADRSGWRGENFQPSRLVKFLKSSYANNLDLGFNFKADLTCAQTMSLAYTMLTTDYNRFLGVNERFCRRLVASLEPWLMKVELVDILFEAIFIRLLSLLRQQERMPRVQGWLLNALFNI